MNAKSWPNSAIAIQTGPNTSWTCHKLFILHAGRRRIKILLPHLYFLPLANTELFSFRFFSKVEEIGVVIFASRMPNYVVWIHWNLAGFRFVGLALGSVITAKGLQEIARGNRDLTCAMLTPKPSPWRRVVLRCYGCNDRKKSREQYVQE